MKNLTKLFSISFILLLTACASKNKQPAQPVQSERQNMDSTNQDATYDKENVICVFMFYRMAKSTYPTPTQVLGHLDELRHTSAIRQTLCKQLSIVMKINIAHLHFMSLYV